jgi:cytochrome c553
MSSRAVIYLALTASLFAPRAALTESVDELDKALLLEPDVDNGKKVYALCATCHLDNGWGKPDGSFPVIAGQHREVLTKQLADIRARNRENPTMYPFSDPDTIGGAQAIADVTAYIATLAPDPNPGQGPGDRLPAGKALYEKQCAECHGKGGQGKASAFFPRLTGQHFAYLVRQLRWLRDGFRKNGNPVMVERLKSHSDEDIEAVADYISRLEE